MRLGRIILLAGLLAAGPARAQATDTTCTVDPVVTNHSTVIYGLTVAYTATAGFLHVDAADGKSSACIYYTAYQKLGAAPSTRPLTFAFNGGPGSASIWLHLGAFGPKRVDMGPAGLTLNNPFKLVTNDDSLLDLSDVVFIDPVATGFSQPTPGSDQDAFFGVKNDYMSVGAFIQDFLTTYDRWSSPKFLAGESYGGVRGALLARYVQAELGINLNGVVFVSPWMSSATTNFGDPGNDLPYAVYLPTYAMAAYYHKRLATGLEAKDPAALRAEVESFAMGPYLAALVQGSDLPDVQRQALVKQLASYTGLAEETIDELDLRVADTDFFSKLYAEQGLAVGRYDARVTGGKAPTGGQHDWYDPSNQLFTPQYTAAMNDYLINELDFKSALPYVVMASLKKWPQDADGTEFGVMNDLSRAMLDNPQLKIFVAAGYYDLAVPFAATKYNFRHLAPSQGLEKRVTMNFFEAGHMVYTNPTQLDRLKQDLRAFYAPAAPAI